MRNALAGNLSPSLTACNTRPRWQCTRWLIGALLLLAFCPQALVWELVCWWPLGYWPPITVLGDLSPDLSVTWSIGGRLVTDPPITALGDRPPDLSVTWSTCHPASGPRGSLLLTSLTTDDRSDQNVTLFRLNLIFQFLRIFFIIFIYQISSLNIYINYLSPILIYSTY